MNNSTDVEKLSRLRRVLSQSMKSYLDEAGFLAPVGLPRPAIAQAGGGAAQVGAPPSARPGDNGQGALNVHVNLNGGVIFLDDERRMRTLAKEIKRLIAEENRRGLGAGG